jgi:hypothetical protein
MSQPWVILTRRYGGDIRSPTPAQLADAITELYHGTLPGMRDDDDAEHGAAHRLADFHQRPQVCEEVTG